MSVVQDPWASGVYLYSGVLFTERLGMNGSVRLAHEMTDKESPYAETVIIILSVDRSC